MGNQYFPSSDQDFRAWLENFVTLLTTNAAMVGLAPADIVAVTTASDEFTMALAALVTERSIYEGMVSAKKTKRVNAETQLRAVVRRFAGHPGLTDQLRSALGLPIPSIPQTPLSMGDDIPGISLETMPGRVKIHFGTDPTNELHNGKPKWARGVNIYRKKAGDADFTMVGFAFKSPYTDTVIGPATDYTYVVQYRGTKETDLGQNSLPVTVAAGGQVAA